MIGGVRWLVQNHDVVRGTIDVVELVAGVCWAIFGRTRALTIGDQEVGAWLQASLRAFSPIAYAGVLTWLWVFRLLRESKA